MSTSQREKLTARPGGLHLVELYGQPGSGKTTVGQKVAGGLKDEFPDARLWVEVAKRSEVDILWDLTDPFEAPPERSPFRSADQYRSLLVRLLGSQRVLIVLNRVSLQDQERLRHLLPIDLFPADLAWNARMADEHVEDGIPVDIAPPDAAAAFCPK